MGLRCPAAGLPPPPPGNPTAAGLAADRSPPRSAGAPQSDCPLRYPTRSCPCATARWDARSAPLHCSSAPRRSPGQRSTVPATTWSAPGTAPPLCGLGSPAHVAGAAPAAPAPPPVNPKDGRPGGAPRPHPAPPLLLPPAGLVHIHDRRLRDRRPGFLYNGRQGGALGLFLAHHRAQRHPDRPQVLQ